MDITFKFQKTSLNQWLIAWLENDIPCGSFHPSQTKARNKEKKLIAQYLRSKDNFEVTYHIP